MNLRFETHWRSRRTWFIAGMALVGFLTAMTVAWRHGVPPFPPTAEQLFAGARTALHRQRYVEAERLASRVNRRHKLSASALLLAGEAATRAGRPESAIEHYGSIPRDDSAAAVMAGLSLGPLFATIGRLSDAEREFLYVLAHEPTNIVAHQGMAFLLRVTGQRWKAVPHCMALIREGAAGWDELLFLADVERSWDYGSYLQRCAETAPDDMLVRLGLAVIAVTQERSSEARRLLEEIVERAPHLVAARALLGDLLVEKDDETFVKWHRHLPPAADDDPDIWFVRGLGARRRGRPQVAARCFWETVKRAPNHRRGNYQLGQVLIALGETSGHEFARRSEKLFKLNQAVSALTQHSEAHREHDVKHFADLMEEGGRVWEARAWAAWAGKAFPLATWPMTTVDRLSPLLDEELVQTLDSANLALRYDLSGFPDHIGLFGKAGQDAGRGPNNHRSSSIHFDEASDAGIDFVYFNGDDPSTKGARMFESYGGGVAVIDFDGDGWPDLYFTQGGEWKTGAVEPGGSGEFRGTLYRNVEGRSYTDITSESRLIDGGFGQGCAVADFDNDGFPDLYVAHIGRNRLYHNNGDGTFSDVTEACGLMGDTWTSSCVIVDLNADGLPDIFDVTYLTGPGIYEAICNAHACTPLNFDGLPDRLHLNMGNGTFELVPNATPDSKSSKGLGVLAVNLDNHGRPSLLIANDQVPNFLLRNFPSEDRWNIRLTDEGYARGLAFNADGLAGASMGIAAEDVNGDGRIDFFVTNFQGESRVLYLQSEDGLFRDGANAAGLRTPGMPFVGWGTQFLDADRDGEPDLVMVNGHVDDFRDVGGEYHMRSQFFWNAGNGRFLELTAPDVGEFFARKILGRGLARLDWNRDGRMDFVVSNIGSRAALVTNRSTDLGHFLNVRLHARLAARDAIGSVVEVNAGNRHWSKQLVAGDGYMASNERLLQFGLGKDVAVSQLRVNWPSGATTTIRELPVDVTIELVEGASQGVTWRGSQPGPLVEAQPATD